MRSRCEQLVVGPDAMQDHGALTDAIDEEEVGSQMALGKATPLVAMLRETTLAKGGWEGVTGDEDVEDVLECFDVEVGVFASLAVVALEARENDQLSSQRTASRALPKRRPLPAASSFSESLSAARSAAAERFGFARAAHALSAAAALRLPVRALSASISPSLS